MQHGSNNACNKRQGGGCHPQQGRRRRSSMTRRCNHEEEEEEKKNEVKMRRRRRRRKSLTRRKRRRSSGEKEEEEVVNKEDEVIDKEEKVHQGRRRRRRLSTRRMRSLTRRRRLLTRRRRLSTRRRRRLLMMRILVASSNIQCMFLLTGKRNGKLEFLPEFLEFRFLGFLVANLGYRKMEHFLLENWGENPSVHCGQSPRLHFYANIGPRALRSNKVINSIIKYSNFYINDQLKICKCSCKQKKFKPFLQAHVQPVQSKKQKDNQTLQRKQEKQTK